jgi:uncharacterized protein (TIGR03437 family)
MRLGLIFFFCAGLLCARHDVWDCGTTRDTAAERLFLHSQAVRARAGRPQPRAAATTGDRDIGNIAIIEDTGGVVEKLNQFDLDGSTLTFTPSAPAAARYKYAVSGSSYDSSAATQGTPVAALGDDDSRQFALPFAFPFYGSSYTAIFLNSDGNLTFVKPESVSSLRSTGRMTGGPPRIAPLFDDLDPSLVAGGVRYLADSTRAVFTWVAVPEYSAAGVSASGLTFQVRLYPGGRIQFAYSGVNPSSAVVGIAPGNLQGGTNLVSFLDTSGDYSGAIVEHFGNTLDIDIVTLAQRFYQTHEDAYDYLVVYNNMQIDAMAGAVAYESTVRSFSTGHGVPVQDNGSQYGSASRLRSIMNMGRIDNYPLDTNAIVPLRASARDTALTVLGHEAGHLFNAFASIRDPNNPTNKLMLGYGGSHWSFLFDSEASLDEGEQIVDRGDGGSPRFVTGSVTQGYSPLDQYLMGFGPASVVQGIFAVQNAMTSYGIAVSPLGHPASGVTFSGNRLDIKVDDVIAVEGRRTPDSTVAQRRYRFAFILVVPAGSTPPDSQVQQVETYRQQFAAFFAKASSNNAVADATLNRSLKLSMFPAAGVIAGATGSVTVTVQTAPKSDLTITLKAPNGFVQAPASVTIAAGATSATFTLSGLKSGVEELLATPSDLSYETPYARVQVSDGSQLHLTTVSGVVAGSTPTVLRLTDINGLPYPGVRVDATGSVSPTSALTDAQGQVSFNWSGGTSLTVSVAAAGITTVLGDNSGPSIAAVVNAASAEPGISPGALQTLYGARLAGGQTAQASYPWPTALGGVQVLAGGTPLPLLYVSDTQVNFYVPFGVPLVTTDVVLKTPLASVPFTVNVSEEQPGIFSGAILKAGTAINATTTVVHAGDFIEIYCTGLGPTRPSNGFDITALIPTVFVGGVPLKAAYSGLAPGFAGLYQVDVKLPDNLASGEQGVIVAIGTTHSNEVKIQVQ